MLQLLGTLLLITDCPSLLVGFSTWFDWICWSDMLVVDCFFGYTRCAISANYLYATNLVLLGVTANYIYVTKLLH
jgi:hypothetical protein